MTPTLLQASLFLEGLRRVPLDRAQKAITGLRNKSMKVTVQLAVQECAPGICSE